MTYLNFDGTAVLPRHAVVGLFYNSATDTFCALHADGSIKDMGYSADLAALCTDYERWQRDANGWSRYADAYDHACSKFFGDSWS